MRTVHCKFFDPTIRTIIFMQKTIEEILPPKNKSVIPQRKIIRITHPILHSISLLPDIWLRVLFRTLSITFLPRICVLLALFALDASSLHRRGENKNFPASIRRERLYDTCAERFQSLTSHEVPWSV